MGLCSLSVGAIAEIGESTYAPGGAQASVPTLQGAMARVDGFLSTMNTERQMVNRPSMVGQTTDMRL